MSHLVRRFLFLVSIASTLPSLEARTWTEANSGRTIEAEYLSSDSISVTLAFSDGRTVKIDLNRLSPDDQKFVADKLNAERLQERGPLKDFFEEPDFETEDIPVTGEAHPALSELDSNIKTFMAEKKIGALSLAISRNGKLIHQRAFGWSDSDLKEPLSVETRMRMASVTKPVVAAATKTLIAEGKLKPDGLVYDLLNLDQYREARDADPRWKKVTIQQLLDHEGGWEKDFTFYSDAICDTCRIDLDEMEPVHVVRFALTQPMEFEPGEKEAYCNLGYILLVRVVEAVSGKDFISYLKETIGAESNSSAWNWSTADAKDRNPKEGWYIYHPEYDDPVYPLPSRTQARDGAGALACTPADYCRFLETYWITGDRRQGRAKYTFHGSHPGVSSVAGQRPSGLNFAAFCNRRDKAGSTWNDELEKIVDEALEKAKSDLTRE